MSIYLASYDIPDDRRRTRVARFLLSFGRRVQQSVYEVFLDPDELDEFRRDLGSILSGRDAFLLAPIDERGSRTMLSWGPDQVKSDAVILV